MDEATKDIEQLQQQLSEVLAELDKTTTNVVERIRDDSPGLRYADLAEGTSSDAEVSADKRDAADPRQTADLDEIDLEAAVEQMLQQAISDGREPTADPEALDDELARLGDELLRRHDQQVPVGEIDEPEPFALLEVDEPITDLETTPQSPAGVLVDRAPEPVPGLPGTPVRIRARAVIADEPSRPSSEATLDASSEAPSSAASEGRLASELVGAPGAWSGVASAWRRVEPTLLAWMVWLSRPLAGSSPMVRSAVGWVAVVTAFWAFVVLVYAVAIREPASRQPTEAPVRLVEPE